MSDDHGEMADTQPPAHGPVDRARALRATLATLGRRYDTCELIDAEMTTPAEVQRFITALLDVFSVVLSRRLKDPAGYLESWIAVELSRAETDHRGDTETP